MENKLLIVGTVAYDTIETPYGKRERVMGGSGVYASLSARLFGEVSLFSTIGEDYIEEDLLKLKNSGIDIDNIKKIEGEKSFFWEGSYKYDLNNAETIKTELNCLLKFETKVPEAVKDSNFLFLANIDPDFQKEIVLQMKNLKFSALDTMNYWIETKREKIFDLFKHIDLVFLNEWELKLLTGENNTFLAAEKLLNSNLKNLVVKRGEYGSILFSKDKIFIIPAYPLRKVVDPTGAGDSFAGAFMGFLKKKREISFEKMKEALIFATVSASFAVSDFSVDPLLSLDFATLKKRKDEFLRFLV
jgi:sugar/nucleoside kinase (ribokinase family)